MHIRQTSLRPGADAPANQPDTLTGSPATLPPHPLMEPFRQPAFGGMLAMLIISGGAFLLYDWFSSPRWAGDNDAILIMLHYGLAGISSLLLLTNGFFKYRRPTYDAGRPTRWIGLLLWLISAYALNREMAVFQESTGWLCGALVTVGAAMAAYAWKDALSVRAQQLLYVVLAMGWWLFVYMAVYVAQLYPISIPLLIGLGLSIHTFVPLAFAVVLGKRLWFDTRREEHLRLGVVIGLVLPLIAVGVFLTGWTGRLNRMEQTRMESVTRQTSDLPDWVLMAQQLQPDWITNRLLLAGKTFDRGRFFDGDWGLTGLTNLDDVKVHDPLVVIASRLFPFDALPESDNLKLLNVLNANRHSTEEKFWTGRHLTTQNVVSQVRIWPQFRVSYTEKTIQVRNQSRGTTEEALYTFHLPPGSVVSSMSLWVNGREEPARLTTVAKADSAYRQIVNVESKVFARDPSVVSWQEGNRVTVRIFPCRANEDRRMKVGITSPLGLQNGQLMYQNPYFDGPVTNRTNELVKVEFAQSPDAPSPGAIESPWLGDKLIGNTLTHGGQYTPGWTLRFAAPALSSEPFVLDEHTYHLEQYNPVSEPFTPKDIYLDVNALWTKPEFETAFRQATHTCHSRVWVFDDGLKKLTETDLNATYERLTQQRFSLFPVYRIANPATALLITKGTPISPTLSDLKNSPFADRMQHAATQSSPIRTFCYGNDLSPYLKTLSELRVLTVMHGDTADLIDHVAKAGQFLRQPDDSAVAVLPNAGVAIHESSIPASAGISQASVAPDHLARLFTYNHLLQQIGRHYFAKNYQTDALILEAQRAHIVSPLSSLVVLETSADYDRFGIKKDASGLDNATLKQEGAVPEPHEWALLAMLAVLIGWMLWKKHHAVA